MNNKNLDKIREIKKSVEKELLGRPGVTAVEIGHKIKDGKQTDEIAIRVHVKEKKNVPQDQMIPSEINGVKTDVIQRKYFPQPLKMSMEELASLPDMGTYDPLTGGISIGPCRAIGSPPSVFAGTLGTLVIDKETRAPMMLSNFHVMALNNEWSVGDTIAQPSLVDRGRCPGNTVGRLQNAILGNSPDNSDVNGQNFSVDCAVATIDNVSGSRRGITCQVIEFQPGVAGNIAGIFNATPNLNMPVRKRGRTTGLTFGFIEAIDQTVVVDYGPGIGSITLTNQFSIAPDTSRNPQFSDHGDSGSVVLNDNAEVIGLLFAGSEDGHSSVNHIQAVFDALNITICSDTPMTDKEELDGINIDAEAMNIKAEAMNIKAEAMKNYLKK